MLSDEARYKILKTLEANPDISQRQLAVELGISLGKVNFCINALIQKGMIKARNFSKSDKKVHYLYVLTPSGIESKAALTKRFLASKIAEYTALKSEIAQLQKEVDQAPDLAPDLATQNTPGAES